MAQGFGVVDPPTVCPDPAVHGPHDIQTPVNTTFHCEGRQTLPISDVVSRAEYERVRDAAVKDHELMQSRIDNQKAIIDRLQAVVTLHNSVCPPMVNP